MMVDLSPNKLLDALLDPVAWIWLALLGASIRAWRSGSKRSAGIGGLSVFLIWLLGATPLPHHLLAHLEKPWIVEDWEALPKADAIVCLGGGLHPQPSESLAFSASDASDRYLTALDLYHRGLASNLVFGGGTFLIHGQSLSEGQLLKAWVEHWGLGEGQIHLLGRMATTRDECVEVKALMEQQGWERLLLVTSAWHMKRSEALFRRAGMEVIPVGCDLRGSTGLLHAYPWKIVPSSEYLDDFHMYLHEWVGQLYYRARGWI
ncbi:MAG: YdcF family protein [Verrucomicrobia bacterium]|nr:YdcF family protein [Verrucomicrobiota bacterium]